MDSWNNLTEKMEKALELFNLEEALSHLDALITTASSPSDVANLLRNHTLKDLPTLHYLTGFPYREEDLPHLERLIRIFTDSGYNINKTLSGWARQLSFRGIPALLASVKKENVILLECLLRCGAMVDIRDRKGLTPCHWAIKKGNLKCLQKLLEHGGSELVRSAPDEQKEILPLLHEAVHNRRLGIVRYLLSKEEEFGVDVTQEVYFDFTPAWYANKNCSPLVRALDKKATPIIQVLMEHPRIKSLRFEELHSLIISGLMKQLLPFLDHFSDEELSTCKFDDQWALHHIHRLAIDVEYDYPVYFTNKVISEFVRRGWDPNSVSSVSTYIGFYRNERLPVRYITKFNLLHFACLYKGRETIELLVGKFGVDIETKLEGPEEVELTPLQILLSGEVWDSAELLIEKGADLNVSGNLGNLWGSENRKYLQLMRRNTTTGNLELSSSVTTVELLVRMGNMDGLPILNQFLARPDVVWQGANEFHLALEGMNPIYIAEVVDHCAKLISKEDLNWVKLWKGNGEEPEKVASLVWLFDELFGRREWEDMDALADLVKLMVELGYDLNAVEEPRQPSNLTRSPLIFQILRYDLEHQSSDRLLRTILQFDHLQLNVVNVRGLSPLEYLLFEWNRSCGDSREGSMCWKYRDLEQPPILETLKLLLAHGLDISEMVIGANFTFHRGFNLILKLLYRFGAKISEEFFTSHRICPWGSHEDDALAKEIEELKEWKDDFDRETGLSLKHISGLRARKMLKCVGDLKMLEGLPRGLKEDVIGSGGGPIDSSEMDEDDDGSSDISESIEDD